MFPRSHSPATSGDLETATGGAVPNGDVWIVIAAYNEESVLESVLGELREWFPDVVVVDDGSEDGTSTAARAAGAVVIEHPVNLGQGAALQTGITAALRFDAEYIVTFDADGQHRPKDVMALLEALVRTGADIALGDRFAGSTPGMPRSRRVLLRIARRFTSLTTGVSVSDPHNGLRAFRASAARRIRIRQNRMAHASEIIAAIDRQDLSVVEVPVEIRYTDYSKGKGQGGLDAVNILLDLVTGRLNR